MTCEICKYQNKTERKYVFVSFQKTKVSHNTVKTSRDLETTIYYSLLPFKKFKSANSFEIFKENILPTICNNFIVTKNIFFNLYISFTYSFQVWERKLLQIEECEDTITNSMNLKICQVLHHRTLLQSRAFLHWSSTAQTF